LAEQGADGLHFTDRDRLDPITELSGGLGAYFWEKAQSLAETCAIPPTSEHPPNIVWEGRD
jgi:hypothetical protein